MKFIFYDYKSNWSLDRITVPLIYLINISYVIMFWISMYFLLKKVSKLKNKYFFFLSSWHSGLNQSVEHPSWEYAVLVVNSCHIIVISSFSSHFSLKAVDLFIYFLALIQLPTAKQLLLTTLQITGCICIHT